MDKLNKTASPMQVDIYPLPDSLYPQSKDWVAADYAGRVEWLHSMYENRKDELDCFLAAQGQRDAATRAAVKEVAYGAGMREALSLIAEHAEGATGQSGMGMDSGWVGETARAALGQGGVVAEVWPSKYHNKRLAAIISPANGYDYETRSIAAAWLAERTAPPASPAGVPDGMVLVPWEPTPAMLAIYEHIRSGSDWQAHVFRLTKRQLNRHRSAYKAMIDAAIQGERHEH